MWKNEKAIDIVVREQSKALVRERILVEEVNFFKDEVDRLELVLGKDNLKIYQRLRSRTKRVGRK